MVSIMIRHPVMMKPPPSWPGNVPSIFSTSICGADWALPTDTPALGRIAVQRPRDVRLLGHNSYIHWTGRSLDRVIGSFRFKKTLFGCVAEQEGRYTHFLIAGWSSLVARQAHNLKVAGSNPAPATKLNSLGLRYLPRGALNLRLGLSCSEMQLF